MDDNFHTSQRCYQPPPLESSANMKTHQKHMAAMIYIAIYIALTAIGSAQAQQLRKAKEFTMPPIPQLKTLVLGGVGTVR